MYFVVRARPERPVVRWSMLVCGLWFAVQGGCGGSRLQPDPPVLSEAPSCVPVPVDGRSGRHITPSKDEVVGQATRVAPYVKACGRRFASDVIIVTRWVVSGTSGKVTKLDLGSSRGTGTPELAISAEHAFCIAAAFNGVCFVPFDEREFRLEYPFMAR